MRLVHWIHMAAQMDRRTLVVAGNGMVGHKLLEILVERGATAEWDIVTFCEEGRPAYDRVGLSSFFNGTSAEELSLVAPGFFDQLGLTVHVGDAVASIDRDAGEVVSTQGRRIAYDALVLATGSYPFVPPVPGKDAPGCFVYRTLDDLEAIQDYAAGCRVGAVVGGGLLGLEAANALRSLGLETHVVEFADRLMPVQVDDGGGSVLRRRIEDLGVAVHTGMATTEIVSRRPRAAWPPCASRRATTSPSTSWCSRPASAPATSWPATPAWPSASGAAWSSTRRAAPPTRGSSPSASVAAVRRPRSSAWSRPATRWPGWPPTASSAATRSSPAPTCPPSSS